MGGVTLEKDPQSPLLYNEHFPRKVVASNRNNKCNILQYKEERKGAVHGDYYHLHQDRVSLSHQVNISVNILIIQKVTQGDKI